MVDKRGKRKKKKTLLINKTRKAGRVTNQSVKTKDQPNQTGGRDRYNRYVCSGVLPESLCDVTSWLMVSLSILSPPPAPPLPKVRDSCRLIFRILSMSGGREGGGGCDAEGGGAASLETAPGQVEGNHVRTKTAHEGGPLNLDFWVGEKSVL